ncbi:ABC transporter ATP-binding protein [Metabacillus rhizolycopersici]|uniref:ABC transporter ATP-binding protein n=1 Tax=Metabacillus rhizolycopersici TaxID=2875709 RepID=A0ABS7UV37_9BACI|nr:ABC transporter ATP-binding protein [Metabacillus rhizolycopersici]MBZ5751794.1 ABC transporter ATP-binding protein [Metabacillus rhizolycopersici]
MIEFKNIQIKFGDFTAIHNLNLEIKEGEFFTLLGPSGCGKTTTLRSLVGFINPTNGDILVNGERINDIPVERREIGMVFQSYALFPTMNVYENLAFGLQLRKYKKDEVDKQVREIARKVDLNEEQLFKKVSDLSGGQQQRVAIARALVIKPKILVLDEPLSNLDAKLRKQLRGELKKLQSQFGITSIYVTHDQEEALTMSDRIAVFNKGNIEQVGTPKEIFDHSKTEFVCNFIGDNNFLQPSFLQRIKNECNVAIDPSKKAYIRPGKVTTKNVDVKKYDVIVEGEIVEKEYHGISSKVIYELGNQRIANMEIEDNSNDYGLGSRKRIAFQTSDILAY